MASLPGRSNTVTRMFFRSWGRDRDVAVLGVEWAYLAAAVRLLNSIVVAIALAVVLSRLMPAVAMPQGLSHWETGTRDVMVVDQTGSPHWQDASRQAVDLWNAAGADLRLVWTPGTGSCEEPEEGRITVCQVPEALMEGSFEHQGIATQIYDGEGHASGALVEVCGDCGLTPEVEVMVAIHELGHALGLNHSNRLESVMFPNGGFGEPDAGDYATLRELYGHQDPEG